MKPRSSPLRKLGRRPVRLIALAALGLVIAGPTATSPSSATVTSPAGTTATESRDAGDFCSAPLGVSCVLDIPYIDDGTSVHTLDAYYPTDLTDRASVVVIHGGFWRQGSSRLLAPEARYLAQNGFAAFSINYAKSRPDRPSWPQVRADVEAATVWVMSHADQYHGDNDRVGVLGGSSGAHLAALLDTAGPENGVAPLATVSWSGAMDLVITYDQGNRAAKHSLFQLLGCRPDECPRTYAAASPVTHVSSDDGSMLFFHSSDERIPVAGAHEMNKALAAAGVPHTLVVFKSSTKHARQYECDRARVADQTLPVIDDSVRWLGIQLNQPTTPTGTFCATRTSFGSATRVPPDRAPAG